MNHEFLKEAERYKKKRRTAEIINYLIIGLVALSLIGVIVFIILLGLGGEEHSMLYAVICCSLLGVVLLCGLALLLLMKRAERLQRTERDFLERADGEESFLVGEGTFATFQKEGVLLHGITREKKAKSVLIPYSEMRFFSVCTRRAPKEKGEWNVLFEIPVKYLAKGQEKKGEPPALIQTDAKPRLYQCIAAHGLVLLGEEPGEKENKRFTRIEKFTLPDAQKRRKTLIAMLVGLALLAGGVGVAFLQLLAGSLVAVFGVYFFVRGLMSFLKAKRVLAIYKEGLYWSEPTGVNNVFLKWEEVEKVSLTEAQPPKLQIDCIYGAYEFPVVAGAFERVSAQKDGTAPSEKEPAKEEDA